MHDEPLTLKKPPTSSSSSAGAPKEFYLSMTVSGILLISCLLSTFKTGLLKSLSQNVSLKGLQKTQRGNEHMFASPSTQKLPT